MTTSSPGTPYVLGNTDAEHDRLALQDVLVGPLTERLFRSAGIKPGQRVLDLGSGAGDVAMLLARLVGPSGEVVGVERDPSSIARARARALEAGLGNVSFTQADVGQIPTGEPFDAAVGRFILMFLPDPVAVVRGLAGLVRPGGVIAFQEVSWAPFFSLVRHLPLTLASGSLVHDTIKRSGANLEMGPALHGVFKAAGLPAPSKHLEMPFETEAVIEWIVDILHSLEPQIKDLRALQAVGGLEGLRDRLRSEIVASGTAVPWIATVGAWATK
jgi:SAM-dependent methyltransferase